MSLPQRQRPREAPPPDATASSPLVQRKLKEWLAIKYHLHEWYAEPDLECLRASLAIYQSHFNDDAPVWAFLLGPPSTGKSELCIHPLSSQPLAHNISTITEASFISSYSEKAGILPNLETTNGVKNGVLLFSDFSNFLCLNPEVRGKLQAQMREIYDGKYQKHSGNRKTPVAWEGKVTILAACTPDLERYWGLENSLGDRFLQLQLIAPKDQTQINACFERQTAYGKKLIQKKTQKLINRFLEDISEHPQVSPASPAIVRYLMSLTNICVSLRQSVHRNYQGKLMDVGTKEGTPRFARMALNLAKTHARMFGKTELTGPDNRLLRRVLLDTCPSRRLKICKYLLNFTEPISFITLRQQLPELTYMTAYRTIEDLEALQLIDTERVVKELFITLKPEFRSMLEMAQVPALEIS